MTVQAYRTQNFETTHENRIFDALLRELKSIWSDSADLVILLGNFHCQGAEIDAAVLKRDSITVIDFKDYGGTIHFSENGRWLADNVKVKGGSKSNPYLQIRSNKFSLLESLRSISLPSGNQPNLGHISGLVLFHKTISFDDQQLPSNIERWFHVVDFEHVLERLTQIASREINLSNQDLNYIAESLNIPEYTPVGLGTKAATSVLKRFDAEGLDFPYSLHSATSQVERFLSSTDRVMVITGMMGTGLEILLNIITHKASHQLRPCFVLSPNSRIAARYEVESRSIYSYLYSANPKLEKDMLVYGARPNKDVGNQLYLISDAHLVSNSKFETDNSRYGSGQLLADFFEFVALGTSKRQVIFLGDPFQIVRGKATESALCSDLLQSITGSQPFEVALSHMLPGQESRTITQNGLKLAAGIETSMFSQVCTVTDDRQVIEAPEDLRLRGELLKRMFLEAPQLAKFVAYTHTDVNRINGWVRQRVFSRGTEITAGDIVEMHSSYSFKPNDGLKPSVYAANGSFLQVISVSQNVEPIIQQLKGREHPVIIRFLKIKAKLLENSGEIEFLCIEGYLYAEKPELDPDVLIALFVSRKSEFDRNYKRPLELSEKEPKGVREAKLAAFLEDDPYFRAVRLRFGYALTLHRAQGRVFRTVVANMDIGQGQTNEAYFRWAYTLFSVAQDKIILSNVLQITAFDQMFWDGSQGKLDSVRPNNLIAFNPNELAGDSAVLEFPIPEKPLRNLYLQIEKNLRFEQIKICSYKHNNYQDVYDFERAAEPKHDRCSFRIHYNGKYQVTNINTVSSEPIEFASQVRTLITSSFQFESDFQKTIYDWMKAKLSLHGLSIQSIEHHSFHEIYYIKLDGDEALKLKLFYDGKGFMTNALPVAYTSLDIVENVRLALGL